MSKIGIEIKIDVTKIDKTRIYQGQKGKYITLTSFVDLENEDQYGNSGFVTHAKTKQDGDVRLPILGNTRIFWREERPTVPNTGLTPAGQQRADQGYDDPDTIPF